MGRPRETIDAAMLATAIRVDGTVKTNVGRIVAGDDLSRGIQRDRGLEGWQFIEALPAIVERNARLSLEPPAVVGLRPAPAPPLALDRNRKLRKRRKRTRRLGGRRDRRGVEGLCGWLGHFPKQIRT